MDLIEHTNRGSTEEDEDWKKAGDNCSFSLDEYGLRGGFDFIDPLRVWYADKIQ